MKITSKQQEYPWTSKNECEKKNKISIETEREIKGVKQAPSHHIVYTQMLHRSGEMEKRPVDNIAEEPSWRRKSDYEILSSLECCILIDSKSFQWCWSPNRRTIWFGDPNSETGVAAFTAPIIFWGDFMLPVPTALGPGVRGPGPQKGTILPGDT